MSKKYPFTPLLLILLMAGLLACSLASPSAPKTAAPQPENTRAPSAAPQSSTFTAAPNPPENTLAPSPAGSFTDPFAYCDAVGTLDAPDSRYSGPPMPDVLVQGLKKASGASADAPDEMFTAGGHWRCMDGKVYACTVGANLPCASKANTGKIPTQAETGYCQANPDSDFIPAYVTGHDTIYAWRCKQDQPEIDQQVFHVDKQGFITEIWYEIPPQ